MYFGTVYITALCKQFIALGTSFIENAKNTAHFRIGRNIGKRMKRNLEGSKRLDSSRERLSTRKRKAEVIDAGIPFSSLWRNRASKGSRKLDGVVGSKTRKVQFIHQSLD